MGLNQVFSEQTERTIRYVKELVLVILSPRQYVRKISEETPDDSIRRFIVYAIGFCIFEIAVFNVSTRGHGDISLYDIVGLTILEVVISLLLLPGFIVIAYALRVKPPIRVALTYALSARFLLMIPPIILYAVFLLSEDYALLLLDPIGHEVDDLDLTFDGAGTESPVTGMVDQIRKTLSEVLKEKRLIESEKSSENQTLKDWLQVKQALLERWQQELKRLEQKRSEAEFDTTRRLIDLRVKDIEAAQNTANAIERFLSQPSLEGINNVFDNYIHSQQTTIDGLKAKHDHLSIRVWLQNLGLLL